MKKILLATIFLLSAISVNAQVPATVRAHWLPNPASQNIVRYLVTLDSAAPIITLPSVCTTVDCVQAITIPTFGSHTVTVVAQALLLSTDPTSFVSGPPASITFTLGTAPTVVSGLSITN